jgi:phage tail-like protein
MMARQFSLRLDARTGWHEAALSHVSTRGGRLGLETLPGTTRPLADPNGGFAGMAMPMRVAACADGSLFVLDATGRILRYDPCRERFEPWPCLDVGDGRAGLPVALACHPGGELLILDGQSKTIVALGLASRRIRRRWGKAGWDPQDLAVLPDGRIAVSDRTAGLIRIFDRRGRLCLSTDGAGEDQPPLSAPTAIAADKAGRLYVVEAGRAAIAILEDGRIVERTEESERLAGRFTAPNVAVDDDGTIWISDRVAGVTEIVRCDCSGLRMPPQPAPLTPAECALLAFDADGHAILGDPRSPCLTRTDDTRYAASGEALIGPLDIGFARTVWDRIELDGSAPQGTALAVAALTTDVTLAAAEIALVSDSLWTSIAVRFDHPGRAGAWTAAVLSPPGRYLWLKLRFASDGFATPSIDALTVRAPRISSARYLPGCFQGESIASADFLERFMGIFDEARRRDLALIAALPALFDPMATPAAEPGASGADFLDWLAGWIGIALDRNWSVARRRRLVEQAPSLFRIRGTVAGLKRHIAVYTGVAPQVVEHFRLRRWLSLDEGRLGADSALWGPEIVRRLQLDRYSEIGRFALVDGGDPLTDPIDAYAHRATLYVPVDGGFDDADLASLEEVAEQAKPAHVELDIRLMRPRFVIGCDLVLGVNTVLGRDSAPATVDQSVLGEEIHLADAPTFTLAPGVRLGVDTTLE